MSSPYSHLTPAERIERLERELGQTQVSFDAVGRFGIMLLEQTLKQLVGERLLPAETEREIWRRINEQMSMIGALNSKIALGAEEAIPPQGQVIRSLPAPRTHREKLRLRMRKGDEPQ